MITIGTARFDIQTVNEPFARTLNGRWDAFFQTSFEAVVEEVLSAFDSSDQLVEIGNLPLDLGHIEEEDFYKQFPLRLREALNKYWLENIIHRSSADVTGSGIRIISTGQSAFELLSFFLLHGYFPANADAGSLDLNQLLSTVIGKEAYRFKEFLNAYGHYDFLCQRLVFQFSDEQLEEIVRVVQPSESIFINLYVRVQMRTHAVMNQSDITREEYRNAVWTLVLAYLFAESGGSLNRKQLIVHTLRGLAAHLNYSFAEMTRLLTESIQQLEHTMGQLPELWSILKDIRLDVQDSLWTLEGDYYACLLREAVSALRTNIPKEEASIILSQKHLYRLLVNADYRRKLLQRLHEQEIRELVVILIPAESEYIISYAHLLDKHRDGGTFTGKAGNEFRLLKWEFIFAVLTSMAVSAFNRRQFVLSVLQQLAAHYNLSVNDLIHWLYTDKELRNSLLASGVLPVLEELIQLFSPAGEEVLPDEAITEEWWDIPLLVRRFVNSHTEQQIVTRVLRTLPLHGEFVVGYAALLDKSYDSGMLEGKAGGEFRTLKWEFIFSCISLDGSVAFHQKIFVYTVLQRLAAHYNQEITSLISYFMQHASILLVETRYQGLKKILNALYEEHLLPMVQTAAVRSRTDGELEHWIISLLGANTLSADVQDIYIEKWIRFLLEERNDLFRALWKAGRLNEAFLLQWVSRTPALRSLWLQRIGDGRLLAIYQRFRLIYTELRAGLNEFCILEAQTEFLSIWMVELTAKRYLPWSEKEIIEFLIARVYHSAPYNIRELIKKMSIMGQHEDYLEAIRRLQQRENEESSKVSIDVNNAGMMLIAPFYPMLFHRLGFLTDNRREFKSTNDAIHAIFLIQYLIYGEQREWNESELYLNKIMVGLEEYNQPLPRTCELRQEDKSMVDDMIKSICKSWDKMRNTSMRGFMEAFLQRKGRVVFHEYSGRWEVKVEQKAYDVLIDSLPWTYTMCKYPWQKNMIDVKWR